MWADALVGGGFALAGVAMQHAFSHFSESRRAAEARNERRREERHEALVEAIKAARRVQRGLVDTVTGQHSDDDRFTLEYAINALAEQVAALRIVVDDEGVVDAFRQFEAKAKDLQRDPPTEVPPDDSPEMLRTSPLIAAIQRYEARTHF